MLFTVIALLLSANLIVMSTGRSFAQERRKRPDILDRRAPLEDDARPTRPCARCVGITAMGNHWMWPTRTDSSKRVPRIGLNVSAGSCPITPRAFTGRDAGLYSRHLRAELVTRPVAADIAQLVRARDS